MYEMMDCNACTTSIDIKMQPFTLKILVSFNEELEQANKEYTI